MTTLLGGHFIWYWYLDDGESNKLNAVRTSTAGDGLTEPNFD